MAKAVICVFSFIPLIFQSFFCLCLFIGLGLISVVRFYFKCIFLSSVADEIDLPPSESEEEEEEEEEKIGEEGDG